jgi:hypothetical protein
VPGGDERLRRWDVTATLDLALAAAGLDPVQWCIGRISVKPAELPRSRQKRLTRAYIPNKLMLLWRCSLRPAASSPVMAAIDARQTRSS